MSLFYKKLRLVGLSFKTADVAFRESFSSQEKLTEFINLQIHDKKIQGAFSLSTCNRVEICYELGEEEDSLIYDLVHFFSHESSSLKWDEAFYFKKEEDVIKHVFKVASSLDSLVVGEPQITAQFKKAYQDAHKHNLISGDMHKFVHKSLSVSKKIKSDTEIGKHAVSISYVAVELIKKVFDDLRHCNVLLLGAGEMAELCLKHLQSKSIGSISIANRSLEKALDLAKEYKTSTLAFDQYKSQLKDFDIIIASTSAKQFILEHEDFKKVMAERKNKPVFVIDIAVPRNVNPDIQNLEEVYLYNVDDLEKISVNNQKIRHDEALKADLIIKEEVNKFVENQELEANKQSILHLRQQYETMFSNEMKKIKKLLQQDNPELLNKIEKSFEAIQKKLLASPIEYVKSKPSKEKIEELKKIFNIDDE